MRGSPLAAEERPKQSRSEDLGYATGLAVGRDAFFWIRATQGQFGSCVGMTVHKMGKKPGSANKLIASYDGSCYHSMTSDENNVYLPVSGGGTNDRIMKLAK